MHIEMYVTFPGEAYNAVHAVENIHLSCRTCGGGHSSQRTSAAKLQCTLNLNYTYTRFM